MIKVLLLCITLVPGASLGQNISWGIRGGVPLTDALEVISANPLAKAASKPWTLGPTLEVNLPRHFGFSIDMLYRSIAYEDARGTQSASQWTVPVLVRYRFGSGSARPFLTGGPNFTPSGFAKTVTGVTLGAGLQLRAPLIRLTPELRFTQFGTASFREAASGLVRANRTQFDFLVGLTF